MNALTKGVQLHMMIDKAIIDCEKMNTDRQWAKITVETKGVEPIVKIDYGTIHHNGMHERAIATQSYFVDSEGKVRFFTHAHA